MANESEGNRVGDEPIFLWALCLAAVVLALWILTPFAMKWLGLNLAERGQAGDIFGSINALFSGLAFGGVIIAILLQRKELALQRRELMLTREEIKRSASAQEAAHDALQSTMHAQTFRVALDILDSAESVEARRQFVRAWLAGLQDHDVERWGTDHQNYAETIIRGYESVGTLIFRGLIPAEFVLSTRSIGIAQYWSFLEAYVVHVRGLRLDPYFGADFEKLAGLASEFLENAGGVG